VKSQRTHKSSSKDTKTDENKAGHAKDEKKKDLSRSLWISGLSSVTKAIDLKDLFSQHGKVIGAKVVTSAKTPGSQCFGFVTMSTDEESVNCIEKLHKSVLHEKTIQVEKAKTDPTPSKKPPSKSKSGDRKDDEKSRSVRHSAKSSSSRVSRRDDRSSRRSREETKKSEDKKHNEKLKKPSDSKVSSKPSSPKRSASKESSKSKSTKVVETVKVKSRSASKEAEKNDDVVVIEEKKAEKKTAKKEGKKDEKDTTADAKDKDAEKEKKEEVKDDKEKEKNIKTLEEIRKERADKIEREHKMREERKKKERERERQLREERYREQQKREKERKERARKEAERLRREREKQRELEKEREREREKERERFIRERREREEKERKEREKEREQLERERLERERLERERRERERLENERIAREKEERERAEKERMAREEQDFRIERERQRLEKERLERERTERDRRGIMVDRGLGSKRSLVTDERRDYHPEAKRSTREPSPNSRKDFFSPPGNRNDTAANQYGNEPTYDRHRRDAPYNRGSSREDTRVATSRHDTRVSQRDYESTGKDRSGYNQQPSDIRRVVQRDSDGDNYNRERSPHRGGDSTSRYRSDHGQRNQNWMETPNANAPKTLSDVLGRAGLTGILGSRAEEKPEKTFPPRVNDIPSSRSSGDRFYPSSNHDAARQDRISDRPHERPLDRGVTDYRDTRVDSRDRRPDDYQRTRIDERRDTRYDDRRPDERPDIHGDNRNDYRRDPVDYKNNRSDDFRDDRRDNRPDRRDPPGQVNSPLPNERSFNGDNRPNILSATDRRGLHPLAADIGTNLVPAIIQPRVLPLADVFGRPLQAVPTNPAQALQAGYAAAQGLTLQNVGHTGIQLNRNGRLEYTRMPPPQNNVSLNRRF